MQRLLKMLKSVLLCLLMLVFVSGSGCQDKKQAEYQLQERCGKAAAEYIARQAPRENLTFHNHYNTKLNKCFVLWRHDFFKPAGHSFIVHLDDPNENKPCATLTFFASNSSGYGNVQYIGDTKARVFEANSLDAEQKKWDAYVEKIMEEKPY